MWIAAALPEELAFRGYVLNRLGDLLGRGRIAIAAAVVVASAAFGLAHLSEGLAGILDGVIAGALFAGLYLAAGRNLWLPIVVHGAVDTLGVILLYRGVAPP